MKNLKMLVCLLFALSMSLFLLTGCGAGTGELPALLDQSGAEESPEPTAPSVPSADVETTGGDELPYSAGLDNNGFWIGIKALDFVDKFNYRGLEIPNDVHQISDDALQTEINNIIASYSSTTQVTDRAVVDGDTVNIDFVGSVDGIEFDGGSTGGTGTDVTIGETEYIDDFLAQLIGHKPGETINVEVTFPDDYGEETLAGKDALFVTTINYIAGETIEAELTDAFVEENLSLSYGWATVAEMKDSMRSTMRKQSIEQYFMDYFTSEVTVKSVPDQLTDYQEGVMMYFYQDYADYYGMELSDLIASEGLSSVDELVERYYDYNLKNATYYLVIQAIAEDAGISVSDEDFASYFMEVYGSSDYSSQEAQYGLPYLKHSVLCMKVIDFVVENAILL